MTSLVTNCSCPSIRGVWAVVGGCVGGLMVGNSELPPPTWHVPSLAVMCMILLPAPVASTANPMYISKEDKQCTGTDNTCIYGQCCLYDGTDLALCSQKNCVAGQCMRRALGPSGTQEVDGEPHTKIWWEKAEVAASPNRTGGDFVRYCKCSEGFYGKLCEEEMNPALPIVYALLQFAVTTKFLLAMSSEHLSAAADAGVERAAQEGLDWTAAAHAAENLMMGIGSFSGAVPWSHNWIMVKVLRFVKSTLLEFFDSLCQLLFPSWTFRDTFRIQILVAAMGPILLMGHAWAVSTGLTGYSRDRQQRERNRERDRENARNRPPVASTNSDSFDFGAANKPVFTLLPLLLIPVVGTLFNPIVSCNLSVEWLWPEPVAPSNGREPRAQDTFIPEHLRRGCSWGSGESYTEIGMALLIPFHIGWLVIMMNSDEDKLRHPLKKGYLAWHAQLLVACAISYQCFKNYHPKVLCGSLTCLMSCELWLLRRWQPCRHRLLNDLRIVGAALGLLGGVCEGRGI